MGKPRYAERLASTLDTRSRIYMFGHAAMSKAELKAAREAARSDPELKGSLRTLVLARFAIRIAGGNF